MANNPTLHAEIERALNDAERFIVGFEGDELQEGVDELLASLRAVKASIKKASSGAIRPRVKDGFAFAQQGGSSYDIYLHTHDTRRAAERHAKKFEKAKYRTSDIPLKVPVEIMLLPVDVRAVVFSFTQDMMSATVNI